MIRHVTQPCLCMTTSIIIKITRVISMWTPHWITVEGPMTSGYYCAIFQFCGGGKKKKKKKDDKKTKAFYNWATTGIPVTSDLLYTNFIDAAFSSRRSSVALQWCNASRIGASSVRSRDHRQSYVNHLIPKNQKHSYGWPSATEQLNVYCKM